MQRVLETGFSLGRPSEGERLEHLRFFVDGLVLGLKDKVESWLVNLRERGHTKRRKHAKEIARQGGNWFCLGEQRGHFEGG